MSNCNMIVNHVIYVLGHICYHILVAGLNGYMASVTNLKSPSNKWRCGAALITAMMTVKHYCDNPNFQGLYLSSRDPVSRYSYIFYIQL
ncbi:putative Phosphofructokinase superfamily [Helianthus annuus]|uniref:Phosphofructokinase superfamily n=1 Tax=Helianthus annuus TaxID=4232 RepID=A0A9K3HHH1_HELAN|nr:putative Phosphofructokinase superfamily [Helianthus annuus]